MRLHHSSTPILVLSRDPHKVPTTTPQEAEGMSLGNESGSTTQIPSSSSDNETPLLRGFGFLHNSERMAIITSTPAAATASQEA